MMIRLLAGAVACMLLCTPAFAQSCNTLAGGQNCGRPAAGGPIDFSTPNMSSDPRDRGGSAYLTPFSSASGGFGGELSRGDSPATFGAVTFGSGGARCGGLFRSGPC
jgi:hypothetical protein